MANFQTHISGGILAGAATAVYASTQVGVNNPKIILLIAATGALGSLLPDIDSDSGTPVRFLFIGLAGVVAAIVFLDGLTYGPPDWWRLGMLPLLAYGGVHFVVADLFKKFTHHRGIFHSLPALLIATFGTFLLTWRYSLGMEERMLIAAAMGLGFLSHLVLDEIFAATNLSGKRIKVNHMFGTALKFRSRSDIATAVAYVVVAVFAYMSIMKIVQ